MPERQAKHSNVNSKRSAISTIFSQQIISDGLLLDVMGGQKKNNLSYRFKLEKLLGTLKV